LIIAALLLPAAAQTKDKQVVVGSTALQLHLASTQDSSAVGEHLCVLQVTTWIELLQISCD
jgi:hypothetical protein